jgi:membrane dipeptidase
MNASMPRRTFLSLLSACTGTALVPTALQAAAAAGREDRPWPGLRHAMLIDSCAGSDWEDVPEKQAALIADIRASGLTAIHLTMNGTDIGSLARNYDGAVAAISRWNAIIDDHPEVLLQVRHAADLLTAKRSGRLGIIFAFQDAAPIGEDLDRVQLFYDLGVRVFQLTYNIRNLVGDGCLEPGNAGLSRFGLKLVERLNERKALVDLAHAGERTTREAIAASKAPVAISHTGCAELVPHPRNKTDAELRALADKGGYAGIYLMPFLRSSGQPMAADLIAHLEHAIAVAGEDHVGIGSDGTISPQELTPEYRKEFAASVEDRRRRGIAAPNESPDVFLFLPDLNRADRFARIAQLLSARGHSDARIEKVLGGNFARLLREVWGT